VVVGADAIVLGAIEIGAGARIGAGSVVIKDVPPGAVVVGVPGRTVERPKVKPKDNLEHGRLPDLVAEAVNMLLEKQKKLEKKIERLEGKKDSGKKS
jgi:serine O-acetyltransferase